MLFTAETKRLAQIHRVLKGYSFPYLWFILYVVGQKENSGFPVDYPVYLSVVVFAVRISSKSKDQFYH